MKRPRQFSALVAILLLIFTFGLLLIAYILLYAAQKEQLIFIAVSDNGAIDVTGDVTDRVFYALRELNER